MATVNPAFRLRLDTGDELEDVARAINRMADHLGEARAGLEAEVSRATRALSLERRTLAAVLQGLTEGVVVAAPDGRITLANRSAHALLGAGPAGLLNRSLWELVDRDLVAFELEREERGEAGAGHRLTLHVGGGTVLAAALSLLPDPEAGAAGFVLTLADVSRPVRAEAERRQALAEALEGLRGSLASIRSLSEHLLAPPPAGLEEARALEAIHAEALRLSALVQAADPAALGALARTPWHLAPVAVSEVVELALRRLGGERADRGGGLAPAPREAVSVSVDPDAPAVAADLGALSAALAHLVGAVRAAAGGAPPRLALRARGAVVQVEIAVLAAMPLPALEAALEAPVAVGPGAHLRAREIVQRHAGEAWAFSDGSGSGLRATLPAAAPGPSGAPPGPRFVGAGLRSGADGGPRPPRPGFYDFSILAEAERRVGADLRDAPLDALTFVVLDIETTGLRPEEDRLVSLAAVRVRGGVVREGEAFDALVNPGRPIPAASTHFHGVTTAMVAEAPPPAVVLPAFLAWASGGVLAGHEVWFDLACLAAEARRLGLPAPAASGAVLDTRLLSAAVHGAESSHDLDAVAGRLGIPLEGRHSALGDALITARILARLLPLLERRGVRTLGQALAAAREAARKVGP
jgi:DNA polymerase-3 subunit epsilon